MMRPNPTVIRTSWTISATPNDVQNNPVTVSVGSAAAGGTFGIQYTGAMGAVLNALTIDWQGNVGIATTKPDYPLHLAPGKALRIEGGSTATDTPYFSFGGYGTFGIDAPGVPNGRFVVGNSGNVGIGTSNPDYALQLAPGKTLRIEGESGATEAACFSFGGYGAFGIDAPGVPNGRFVVQNSGNVGIGTSSPTSKLHVAGDVTVTGDVLLTGADCAEQFDVASSENVEPGTVVVIDGSGALRESREPYDKRVAGVVSGAGGVRPAIMLDNRDASESRAPVALVGKVYCKVDASQSPIEIGDLLTTSTTPGHAMKVMEPERAGGSVIGKALGSCDGGPGLIPILVSLQ